MAQPSCPSNQNEELPPADIGHGRTLNMVLYRNGEFLGLEYLPTKDEYREALKQTVIKLPKPSGIYLSYNQANVLSGAIPIIQEEKVKMNCGEKVEYSIHLGGMIFFTGSSEYNCFQIRRYWRPAKGNDIFPTKTGVTIKDCELITFLQLFPIYFEKMEQRVGQLQRMETPIDRMEGCCELERGPLEQGFAVMRPCITQCRQQEGHLVKSQEDGQVVETQEDGQVMVESQDYWMASQDDGQRAPPPSPQ